MDLIKKKCGLIINPIAGMGGPVGLKGTDGEEILKKAVELGAVPRAQKRAGEALSKLRKLKENIEVIAGPGPMGEDAAREQGFSVIAAGSITKDKTTAEDTKKIAEQMQKMGVEIILFAGGDGTARDIYEAVGTEQVCLGIPSGVKIHSAVYAVNPEAAGEIAVQYLESKIKNCTEAEVMDIDEGALRQEIINTKLYGYLKVPAEQTGLQRLKKGSLSSEEHIHQAIAHDIIETISDDYYYIIGAGTTLRPIMEIFNLEFSLLGVDIFYQGRLVLKDGRESEIKKIIKGRRCKLIITPVGGQGYIFGRGNLQLSPDVIRRVGKENVVIAATGRKLQGLKGRPLLSDTGDRDTDKYLEGFYRIVTGYHESTIYKVIS
ncbi:ATP-NAD kinase family protein [bacterium]|nr:ATP-NAD kinase family protein [bacterium]